MFQLLAILNPGKPMAISHELSGEIATALFAAKERSPRELKDLKEMVFAIHATLERLGRDPRTDRIKSQPTPKQAARHTWPDAR
jgi:hypothetical protein